MNNMTLLSSLQLLSPPRAAHPTSAFATVHRVAGHNRTNAILILISKRKFVVSRRLALIHADKEKRIEIKEKSEHDDVI